MAIYSRDQRKIDEIKLAIKEADRFIEKAKMAVSALSGEQESFYHSKSFAAAKRASMDLSRALSALRQRRD
jgi:hypothetical protein